MGKILAIDYGQKRVGLAITDELNIIASALETVSSHDIFSYLHKLLLKENIKTIVVGMPLQMNGLPSESYKYIAPFVKKLSKEFPEVEIKMIDERFTSKMASNVILQSGIKRKKRRDKSLVDKVSAVIILQSYLDQIK